MPKKLYFNADALPPLSTQILLALQHVLVILSALVLPLYLLDAIQAPLSEKITMLQMSLLMVGVGTVLMALKGKRIGPGVLLPYFCRSNYFSVLVFGIKAGGVGAMGILLLIAGITQIVISRFVVFIRHWFPSEVIGSIYIVLGIGLITPIINETFYSPQMHHLHWDTQAFLMLIISIGIMVIVSIWGGRRLAPFALITGSSVGILLSIYFHDYTNATLQQAEKIPLFVLPHTLSLHFSKHLIFFIIPVIITSTANVMISFSNLVAYQKINTLNWQKPDYQQIQRGIFTEGLNTLLAGMLGAYPSGPSTANLGLAAASKITSRYIGFIIGLLLVILSFFPKITLWLIAIPPCIKGAILTYVTIFILTVGIELCLVNPLIMRRKLVIGLTIISGVFIVLSDELMARANEHLLPLVGSSLVIAVVVAVLLNPLLRIGAKKHWQQDFPSYLPVNNLLKNILKEERTPILIKELHNLDNVLTAHLTHYPRNITHILITFESTYIQLVLKVNKCHGLLDQLEPFVDKCTIRKEGADHRNDALIVM